MNDIFDPFQIPDPVGPAAGAPQPVPMPLPDALALPDAVAPPGTQALAAVSPETPATHAAIAAFVVAFVILLVIGQPWRKRDSQRESIAWILAVGAGFLLGCWWLSTWLAMIYEQLGTGHVLTIRWQLNQVHDRFLYLLLPCVLLIELFAVWFTPPWWVSWTVRLAVAFGAGRLLLHDSVYLRESSSKAWPAIVAWRNFGLLAFGLAELWAFLAWLTVPPPSRSHVVSLALTCCGAAVTVMASGNMKDGQLGLPLAGALMGCALASLAFRGPFDVNAWLGPGVVGLFALLAMGFYFGELSPANFLLLFAAPVLGWLPELLPAHWLRGWKREVLRVGIVAMPVGYAAITAMIGMQE